MKRQYKNIINQPLPIIPTDLYQEIALYSDIETIKTLASFNKTFYAIYQNPHFWKDKVMLDFPFTVHPEANEVYDVNTYESIALSLEEAKELLQHDVWLLLTTDVPWFIDLETYSINSIKIQQHNHHYDITYHYLTNDGLNQYEQQLSYCHTIQLLTNLIYNQHIRVQSNINLQ